MSHFYAGCSGRSDATRTGTIATGAQAYAQGWQARGSARAWRTSDDTDQISLSLGCGPSNYSGGSLSLAFPDAATVVDALALGDPRIESIVFRIEAAVAKLNAEAPAALKRAARAVSAARKAESAASPWWSA